MKQTAILTEREKMFMFERREISVFAFLKIRLSSENFPRIKIGVGDKPHENADLKNHVLSNFKADDFEKLGGKFITE